MPSQRRTRFIATVMLLVWLLTLGVGIANACLLHEDHAMGGSHGVGTAFDTRHAGFAVDGPSATQSAPAAHRAAGDADQLAESIPCRALCMAVQMAVPVQKPVACADQHADPVLVATCGPVKALADPMPELSGVAVAPRPELPVFIRFLRMTL